MTGNNITLRQRKKALTRQKVLAAARDLFTRRNYHAVTIRELAKEFGMSTGALFNNFAGKAELFETAMGFPPPVDGPLTRAAPMLLKALSRQTDNMAFLLNHADVGTWYEKFLAELVEDQVAIILATSPLDGEVWARHLESIRRDVPHDCRAESPPRPNPPTRRATNEPVSDRNRRHAPAG